MTTTDRFKNLLDRITIPGFQIVLQTTSIWTGEIDWSLFVQPTTAVDNRTGEPCEPWKSRKWRLSEHSTDGEVVQTAFLAIKTAIEHELREQFLFDGVSVFDPHYDIHKLVELRKSAGALAEREDHR